MVRNDENLTQNLMQKQQSAQDLTQVLNYYVFRLGFEHGTSQPIWTDFKEYFTHAKVLNSIINYSFNQFGSLFSKKAAIPSFASFVFFKSSKACSK